MVRWEVSDNRLVVSSTGTGGRGLILITTNQYLPVNNTRITPLSLRFQQIGNNCSVLMKLHLGPSTTDHWIQNFTISKSESSKQKLFLHSRKTGPLGAERCHNRETGSLSGRPLELDWFLWEILVPTLPGTTLMQNCTVLDRGVGQMFQCQCLGWW